MKKWSSASLEDRLRREKTKSFSFKQFLRSIFNWQAEDKKRTNAKRRIVIPNCRFYGVSNPNAEYAKNEISTTKYTLLTFIPRNFFEQFHRFANIYFLFVQFLNWIPALNAFAKEIQLIPMFFVLFVSALKDIIEDRRRYFADMKVNNRKCKIYVLNQAPPKSEKQYKIKKWKDIRVGDIVHISCNEVIPADILLLKSSDSSKTCYTETMNIDGETYLKQRQAVSITKTFEEIIDSIEIHCDPPNNQIYLFEGNIVDKKQNKTMPLTIENLILRDCVLRNTDYVEGIVLYAGFDTKTMLNNRGPKFKCSKLERMLNKDIVYCIIILVLLCSFGSICHLIWLQGFHEFKNVLFMVDKIFDLKMEIFYSFWSFFIIFQVMVPLSLYVTLELIKLGQIYYINSEDDLFDKESNKRVECRELNIAEDLGQIQYIFSDKTGTLTENDMLFKRCSINGRDYKHDTRSTYGLTIKSIRSLKSLRPVRSRSISSLSKVPIENTELINELNQLALDSRTKRPYRNQAMERLEDFFIVLAICNNVIVSKNPHRDAISEDKSVLTNMKFQSFNRQAASNQSDDILKVQQRGPFYESENPDEIAFVEAAYRYKYFLIQRDNEEMVLSFPSGKLIRYKILKILPFDSERKRMSIIVENLTTKKKVLYCKGADSEIFANLTKNQDQQTQRIVAITKSHVSKYGQEGLRTLCMAKRNLTDEIFNEWLKIHNACETATNDRQRKINESAKMIECDLELLGATGIEDSLQEGVPETIAALRAAGIIIWILTGDKLDTAVNVAFSSRLFSRDMEIISFDTQSESETALKLEKELLNIQQNEEKKVKKIGFENRFKRALVIDGKTFFFLLSKSLQMQFLEFASYFDSALICRATPYQKSLIVSLIREKMKATTLAIGDGANDVSMIQTADVGIGIYGQEGMQAVMASDFSLPKFKFLRRLLLVEGHWCYYRSAKIILHFFYKNSSFVFLLFWYQLYCGFSASVAIDQLYLILYNLLFTSLLPLSFGIYEQYLPSNVLLEQPYLYSNGRNSKVYNTKNFLMAFLEAIYESLIIFYMAYGAYFNSEIGIYEFGTLLVNALVFVHSVHLAFEINSWMYTHVVAFLLSMISFYGFIYIYNLFAIRKTLFKQAFMVIQNTANDPVYWFTLILITFLACAPKLVIKSIMNTIHPSNEFKARVKAKYEAEEEALIEAIEEAP
ncbi:putative phospholipid-transporting ATPase VD-like protein, partial [Dinothrombium tinctorium]